MNNKQTYDFKGILIFSSIIIFIMFIISGYVWTQIPAGEQVCTHWNIASECNRYSSKFRGVFLIPALTAGTMALFLLLSRVDPRASNVAKSSKSYTVMWVAIVTFFLAVHVVSMLNVLGREVDVSAYVALFVGILFIILGNYLGKVRSNFFFGIRTSWTLSSDLSWDKTNRLGGKLLILQGLLFIAGALVFTGEQWVFWFLGSMLALVLILGIYSYFIWKNDPDAQGS